MESKIVTDLNSTNKNYLNTLHTLAYNTLHNALVIFICF